MVRLRGEQNVIATTKTSAWGLYAQQQQMDEIVEDYKDIFNSPIGVHVHYHVKYFIDMTPGGPLPNDPIYKHSVMENEEIKCKIRELILKGHIIPSSSPCKSLIVLVQKKDGTWRIHID
jgi:hypothetical protein